jgi:hypothetical protein
MPPIRADLSKNDGFEIIPAGTYPAVIHTITPGVSTGPKTNGATMLNVRYRLHDGGSVFDRLIIHPSTLWRFKQVATSAGVDPSFFTVENAVIGWSHEEEETDLSPNETWVSLDSIIEQMMQQEVAVEVTVSPARTGPNGEQYGERNEVKNVKPLTDNADASSGW